MYIAVGCFGMVVGGAYYHSVVPHLLRVQEYKSIKISNDKAPPT